MKLIRTHGTFQSHFLTLWRYTPGIKGNFLHPLSSLMPSASTANLIHRGMHTYIPIGSRILRHLNEHRDAAVKTFWHCHAAFRRNIPASERWLLPIRRKGAGRFSRTLFPIFRKFSRIVLVQSRLSFFHSLRLGDTANESCHPWALLCLHNSSVVFASKLEKKNRLRPGSLASCFDAPK